MHRDESVPQPIVSEGEFLSELRQEVRGTVWNDWIAVDRIPRQPCVEAWLDNDLADVLRFRQLRG